MSLISIIKPVSHHFGEQVLFKNITFSVERNSKIGLVGANGSGKSTLFKILTKRILPAAGEVQIAKNLKIAYLTQDPELDESQTLSECVIESRPEWLRLHNELKQAEQQLAVENSAENLELFARLQEQFEHAGGYHYETEMKLVLTSLEFPETVWQQSISTFSGGEKTRIQLAKFLLSPFDLLLLDEPTNHLDISMIYWLENYLKKLDKPYIIISHDRKFLDNTITKIVEIEAAKLTVFNTNYSNYRAEKKLRMETQQKEFTRQQKFIKKTDDFIQKNMAGQKTNQAKSRLKMLEKLDVIEKPSAEKKVKINIQTTKRSGNDVYILENVALGYPGKILAKDINLRVGFQDKIAVLGKNGCGKTTLLNLLNEELQPLSGRAKKGASLQIGYYDQMHVRLEENTTVKDTIWQLVPVAPIGYVLGYLAKFGFTGDDVEKHISILSGGEKARLYLAKLLHEKPNFLIMDEPTNHLDINMIDSLEKAFQDYDGTIVFVSHDRYFIEKVTTKKFFFTQQTIIETEQSLDALFGGKITKEKSNKAEKTKTKKINPYYLEKVQHEIEELERRMEQIHRQIIDLEALYLQPETFRNEEKVKEIRAEIASFQKIEKKLANELDEKELAYLELIEKDEVS